MHGQKSRVLAKESYVYMYVGKIPVYLIAKGPRVYVLAKKSYVYIYGESVFVDMGWLWLVGSIKL